MVQGICLGLKMKLSLTQKSFALVIIISIMTVGATYWLVFGSVSSGIRSYFVEKDKADIRPTINLLAKEYEKHGSWEYLNQNPHRLRHDIAVGLEADSPAPPPVPHGPPGGPPGPGMNFARPPRLSRRQEELLSRTCLYTKEDKQLFGPSTTNLALDKIPILVDGKSVGYIKLINNNTDSQDFENVFVDNLRKNIYTICGFILTTSVFAAFIISREVSGPVRKIEKGLERLSDGEFTSRIELKRDDELGDLAFKVNELGKALGKHEQSRMQWMADTSHELRTPMAILRAQIEAFQDGVQEVNEKTLAVLHGEIMSLTGLVNQLYDLSRADLGRLSLRFKKFKPVGIIQDCIESFEARYKDKDITLESEHNDTEDAVVQCDSNMLKQVFSNLLENSLRYTDSGGKLKVTTKVENEKLLVYYDDSEPSVPNEHYEKLFERFFRVDSSRSRQLGGTGLGLAICKHIIESHSGGISASQSPLGGLRIEVWLPIEGRSQNG